MHKLPESLTLSQKIVQLILVVGNGPAAVNIFFILSGYVLAKSIQYSTTTVVDFYKKRIFRIYPAYVTVIAMTVIYLMFWHHYRSYDAGSLWYHWWFVTPVSLYDVIDNLVFRTTSLSGVTWSLKVEVLGSFLIPVFYLVSKLTSRLGDLLFLLILVLFGAIFTRFIEIQYLYMFYMGIILLKWQPQIRQFRTLLLILSIIILTTTRYFLSEPIVHIVESLAAWIIVALIADQKTNTKLTFLEQVPVRILGDISYSFYLTHFLVLYIIGDQLLYYVDSNLILQNALAIQTLLACISIIVAIIVAMLLRRFIELPAINLGRKIILK